MLSDLYELPQLLVDRKAPAPSPTPARAHDREGEGIVLVYSFFVIYYFSISSV